MIRRASVGNCGSSSHCSIWKCKHWTIAANIFATFLGLSQAIHREALPQQYLAHSVLAHTSVAHAANAYKRTYLRPSHLAYRGRCRQGIRSSLPVSECTWQWAQAAGMTNGMTGNLAGINTAVVHWTDCHTSASVCVTVTCTAHGRKSWTSEQD